ncbi:MAG: zinc-ribbon domain containing protein [Chloroflexota bacterium]
MDFVDKTLTCRDCGVAFVWTSGEQAFYQEKGLLNQPQRCPDCRANKRRQRETRVAHEVVCAECGAVATVPFVPRNNRPVYCSTCYDKVRSAMG